MLERMGFHGEPVFADGRDLFPFRRTMSYDVADDRRRVVAVPLRSPVSNARDLIPGKAGALLLFPSRDERIGYAIG